jgi:hypothetical protein
MTRLPDVSFDEQGRPVLTIRPRNRLLPPEPPPQTVGVPLIGAPGLGPLGDYPQPLAQARQYFDQPAGTHQLWQDNPAWPMRMLGGLLPVKVDEQGQESPAIPGAVRQAAQTGLDVLASPYTGGLPENFVADTALNALGPEMQLEKPRTFLGIRSETADLPKLRRAIKLEQSGVSPEMIRQATGWGRDVANNWNYEISDKPAKYTPERAFKRAVEEPGGQLEMFKLDPKTRANRLKAAREAGTMTTLGEIYQHPELYAAHPELATRPVRMMGKGETDEGAIGYSDAVTGEIGLGSMFGTARGTYKGQSGTRYSGKGVVAHEVQHEVQKLEKFPPGATPNLYKVIERDAKDARQALATRDSIRNVGKDKALQYVVERVKDGRISREDARRIWQVASDQTYDDAALRQRMEFAAESKAKAPEGPNFAYTRTAGEVQARNVGQHRLEMSQEELNATPPEATQDVPNRDQLIIPPNLYQFMVDRARGQQLDPSVLRAEQRKPDNPLFEIKRQTPGTEPTRAMTPGNPFFSFGPLEREGMTARGATPQEPIERFKGGQSTSARGELLTNPTPATQKRLRGMVEKGIGRGGLYWYDAEPGRRAWMSHLGESKGHQDFMENMDIQAGASPLSDVLTNIRNASHYRWLLDQLRKGNIERLPQAFQKPGSSNWSGEGGPEKNMPSPYFSPASWLHQRNMNRLYDAAGRPLGLSQWDFRANPKPVSFGAGLKGNLVPRAVDTHDFRSAGIATQDPRFMTSKATKEGRTPKTALPADWEGKPSDAEYWAAEHLGQRVADQMGIPQAYDQSSRWVGAAEQTGLVTDYNQAFMDLYGQVINRTAEASAGRGPQAKYFPGAQRFYGEDVMPKNMSPEEVLRRHIKDKMPLLSKANPVGAASLAGSEKDPVARNRLLELMGNRS